jgi:hypothetical protein
VEFPCSVLTGSVLLTVCSYSAIRKHFSSQCLRIFLSFLNDGVSVTVIMNVKLERCEFMLLRPVLMSGFSVQVEVNLDISSRGHLG